MNERLCIRCQHPVLLEDGHLSYCSYCGAPQIFLSEELQAEIARETREFTERTTPTPSPDTTTATSSDSRQKAARQPLQPWTEAVQYALLSAAVAMALGLLTLLLPAATFLMLLWVIAAPILTVAFYNARASSSQATSSAFAARLGLLTGLLVVIVCATTYTLNLVLLRYVLHQAAPIDAQLTAAFEQQRTVLIQRLGTSAQPTLDMFAIPEFRVGLMLTGIGSGAALYLLLSATAAGLAGAVLGRRRSA